MNKFFIVLCTTVLFIVFCRGTSSVNKDKWSLEVVDEYYFSERAFGAEEYMSQSSFYIISSAQSMDSANYGKYINLKEFRLTNENRIVSPEEQMLRTSEKSSIVDSLGLLVLSDSRTSIKPRNVATKDEDSFFHMEYSLPINDKESFTAEIIGEFEKSKMLVYDLDGNEVGQVSIPDGVNYFIRMIDLNNDGIKECLVFNCLMNEYTLLKIVVFEKL